MRSLAATACACWVLCAGAVFVGALAVLYAWAMVSAHAGIFALVGASPWRTLLLMPLAGAARVWATRRWFVGAEGSGVSQTIAALNGNSATRRRLLSWRLLLGKAGDIRIGNCSSVPGCPSMRWNGCATFMISPPTTACA